MTQAKVWKMREYFVYFPFFILHDWGKRSAEARSSHLSGVALIVFFGRTRRNVCPGSPKIFASPAGESPGSAKKCPMPSEKLWGLHIGALCIMIQIEEISSPKMNNSDNTGGMHHAGVQSLSSLLGIHPRRRSESFRRPCLRLRMINALR